MTSRDLKIDGCRLTIHDVVEVANGLRSVALAEQAKEKMNSKVKVNP